MPLRDRAALDEWIQRDDPRYSVVQAVVSWIESLEEAPWRAPSAPVAELSDYPRYEVREAVVPKGDGTVVLYRHEFDTDVVDLIAVGRLG